MKGAWAVFLALLATFEPVQPQEYALVVVNDDQDAMSAAGFQRSVRRFCVELRSVTEVEDNEEWASCKEPVTIYQSWNSMGLSCVVWPAATFLAAQLPNIVTFKDVILELGAGTGFTGIATAQSVPGLHAILTDRELAVPCLEANHAANGNSSRVHVAVLDWQQPLPSLPVTPTYIVAADVVYEEALFEPLIATLSALRYFSPIPISFQSHSNPTFRIHLSLSVLQPQVSRRDSSARCPTTVSETFAPFCSAGTTAV
eukprot:m.18359 g.18359  ORF g.18359 m.18359 type:complete len:257 (+) comp10792_c0_seq1:50-820(+)